MVVVAAVAFRATGIGHWGYLAVGTVSAVGGLALLAHAVGIGAVAVGAAVAVLATLSCRSVPGLTARLSRFAPPPRGEDGDGVLAGPEESPQPRPARSPYEDVWTRMRWTTSIRSGLYTGVATSAGLGAFAVQLYGGQLYGGQWAGVAFSWSCAAVLGLYSLRLGTDAERAALGAPAVVLFLTSCVTAQWASAPIPLTAFAALLAVAVVLAVTGLYVGTERPSRHVAPVVAYLTYLSTASLIPLALWAVVAEQRSGVT
jgi:hypothetical protein